MRSMRHVFTAMMLCYSVKWAYSLLGGQCDKKSQEFKLQLAGEIRKFLLGVQNSGK